MFGTTFVKKEWLKSEPQKPEMQRVAALLSAPLEKTQETLGNCSYLVSLSFFGVFM